MKKHLSLFLATLIVALLVFAVFYWLLKYNSKDAGMMAVVSGVAGLIVEYLRPFLSRRRRW